MFLRWIMLHRKRFTSLFYVKVPIVLHHIPKFPMMVQAPPEVLPTWYRMTSALRRRWRRLATRIHHLVNHTVQIFQNMTECEFFKGLAFRHKATLSGEMNPLLFLSKWYFCVIAVNPQSHIEATTAVSSNRWRQPCQIPILRITHTNQLLRYITIY